MQHVIIIFQILITSITWDTTWDSVVSKQSGSPPQDRLSSSSGSTDVIINMEEEEEDEEETQEEPSIFFKIFMFVSVLTLIVAYLIVLALMMLSFNNIHYEENLDQLEEKLIVTCVCLFLNFVLVVLAYIV